MLLKMYSIFLGQTLGFTKSVINNEISEFVDTLKDFFENANNVLDPDTAL